MPKQAKPLSPSEVSNSRGRSKPYILADGGGLFLLVQPNGSRWWRFRYSRPGTGKRNMIALRKLLWKNGVMVHAHDTGGVQTSRTMWVDVTSGEVTLKINGAESKL